MGSRRCQRVLSLERQVRYPALSGGGATRPIRCQRQSVGAGAGLPKWLVTSALSMASRAQRVAGLSTSPRATRFGMKFGLETMQRPRQPRWAIPSARTRRCSSRARTARARSRPTATRRCAPRACAPAATPRRTSCASTSGSPSTDARSPTATSRSPCAAVRDAADRLVRRGVLAAHPTFFEVLTAAAFAHFRRKRVDVAVLEVGLGGRLDATNVAEPVASAIVSVDFDHEVYLGDTLASIAREKAGVMRRGRATVVGPLPGGARGRGACARAVGARLVDARRGRSGGTPRPPVARRTEAGVVDRAPAPGPADTRAHVPRPPAAAGRAPARQPARRGPPAGGGEGARACASTSTRVPGGRRAHPLAGPPRAGRRAIPRSSSTAPTTPPARARSPRTSRGGPALRPALRRHEPTRTCAASRGSCSRSRSPSCSRGHGSPRAATPDELRARAGSLAAEVHLEDRVSRALAPRPPAGAGARSRRPRPGRPAHDRGRGRQPLPGRRGQGAPAAGARARADAWPQRADRRRAGRGSTPRCSAESHSAGPTVCCSSRPSRSSTKVSG